MTHPRRMNFHTPGHRHGAEAWRRRPRTDGPDTGIRARSPATRVCRGPARVSIGPGPGLGLAARDGPDRHRVTTVTVRVTSRLGISPMAGPGSVIRGMMALGPPRLTACPAGPAACALLGRRSAASESSEDYNGRGGRFGSRKHGESSQGPGSAQGLL